MSHEEVLSIFCWACVKSFENIGRFRFVINHSVENEGVFLVIKCTVEPKKTKIVDEDEEGDESEIENVLNQGSQENNEKNFQRIISYLERTRNAREYLSIAEPCRWSYYRYSGNELIRNLKTRTFSATNKTLIALSVGLEDSFSLESSCYKSYSNLSRICKYLVFIFPSLQMSFQYLKSDKTVNNNEEEEDEELFSEGPIFQKRRKRKLLENDESQSRTKKMIVFPHSLEIPIRTKLSMKDEDEEEEEEEVDFLEDSHEVCLRFLHERYNDSISITYVMNPHLLLHMNEVSVTQRLRIINYSEDFGLLSSRTESNRFWSQAEKTRILQKKFFEGVSFFKEVHSVTEINNGGLYCIDLNCRFENNKSINSCCVIIRFGEGYGTQKRGFLTLPAILKNSLKKVNDSMETEKKEAERKEDVDRCVEWISSSIVDIIGMSKNSQFRGKCLSLLGVKGIPEMKNSLEVLVRGKIEEKGKNRRRRKSKKKR